MFLKSRHYWTSPLQACLLSICGIWMLVASGCDRAQPVVYEIPKEDRTVHLLAQQTETPISPTTDASNMQVLPGMQEAANAAPKISYQVPEGWQEQAPSGIRKGNFKVSSDDGNAEITILTFPGDVGGTLANINRWRGQIRLAPASTESSTEFSKPCIIANHEGLYVVLKGDSQSILGAILPFHGNTWFFKMLGDTSVVMANEAEMKQFLDSIHFEDHTH